MITIKVTTENTMYTVSDKVKEWEAKVAAIRAERNALGGQVYTQQDAEAFRALTTQVVVAQKTLEYWKRQYCVPFTPAY